MRNRFGIFREALRGINAQVLLPFDVKPQKEPLRVRMARRLVDRPLLVEPRSLTSLAEEDQEKLIKTKNDLSEILSSLLAERDKLEAALPREEREERQQVRKELNERIQLTEFPYNTAEAQRLGLERLELPAYPEAQRLIDEVIQKAINIRTVKGSGYFVRVWVSAHPTLPTPCVPNETLWNKFFPGKPYPVSMPFDTGTGDFWYLTKLQRGKIISNLTGDPVPALPNFATEEFVLVDSWEETDYVAEDASQKHTSKLLKELLGSASTVNIKREDLDAALWQGDPHEHITTQKHTQLLQKLGVDPTHYELRCIRQDEYARAAGEKGWGYHVLLTNFDTYFLGEFGRRHGLTGGYRAFGGASNVGYCGRDYACSKVSVRLVLSRKQQ